MQRPGTSRFSLTMPSRRPFWAARRGAVEGGFEPLLQCAAHRLYGRDPRKAESAVLSD